MTDKNWAGIELGKRNLHIHTSIICQFHEQFDFNFSCHSSWEARSGAKSDYPDPTMMLLMGMKMSLTKKPMKPMTINPMAVLIATFENSRRSGLWHFLTSRMLSFVNSLTGRTTVSTASILFFPSLLPILYTLSFSFLPLLFTVVSSCSMELPSSRSRRISAHLLSREEMRKNVVQSSKSLLGQGDLLCEARRAYVDEKLHKLTTRKGGRARWCKDARVCADKTT